MPLILLKNIENDETFELPLVDGQIIGRSDECSIVLKHKRISSQHAQIKKEGNSFFILDLESTNGIKLDNQRVKKGQLTEEQPLILGPFQAWLVVKKTPELIPQEEVPTAPPNQEKNTQQKPWIATLIKILEECKWENKKQNLIPFSPLISVKVLSGLSIGQQYFLGYGPRTFGPHSLDLSFIDIDSPPLAFSITKQNHLYFILPLTNNFVLHNEKIINNLSELKNHDLIQVGSTRFEFSYEDDDNND